ncbi:MAG: PDZ domain-containing protein [Ilumatobacteraceae bacterium]
MNSTTDSLPQIAAIDLSSAASRVGLMVGDRVMSVNGVVPRDILEWQRLVDADEVEHVIDHRGVGRSWEA